MKHPWDPYGTCRHISNTNKHNVWQIGIPNLLMCVLGGGCKRSHLKVMFSQVCVCPWGSGVSRHALGTDVHPNMHLSRGVWTGVYPSMHLSRDVDRGFWTWGMWTRGCGWRAVSMGDCVDGMCRQGVCVCEQRRVYVYGQESVHPLATLPKRPLKQSVCILLECSCLTNAYMIILEISLIMEECFI